MLVRPLMINLKLLEMTVLFLHVAAPPRPLLFIKCLAPLVVGGQGRGVSFWTDVHHPPHPQLLASEIKQNFLSKKMCNK